jgi:hypothetical protein
MTGSHIEADSSIADQMDEEDEDIILSAKNKSKWCKRHLDSLGTRQATLQGWTKSLEEYLLCVEDTQDDIELFNFDSTIFSLTNVSTGSL